MHDFKLSPELPSDAAGTIGANTLILDCAGAAVEHPERPLQVGVYKICVS